jgi:hypothetical protein
MTAFRFKENFTTGAGECVSLSALYAAAMFIVGRIPLEKIFLIATPLHSQNFIIEKEGLITNNRRIVTKNMWFNGTSLSEKARRALENERVTIVSHISGYIHTLYEDATIDKDSYNHFSEKLREFLTTDLTDLIFINFLRFKSKYKSLFQYRCECSGKQRFITLEKMFEYEHTSKYNVSMETRELLVNEIEGDEFHLSPLPGKILLNDIENLFTGRKGRKFNEFREEFTKLSYETDRIVIEEMFADLHAFIHTDPRIPSDDKNYISNIIPEISVSQSREEIIEVICSLSEKAETADLALYIYRDMNKISWIPFVKAAIERNPVCFTDLNGNSVKEVYDLILTLPDESIYGAGRLALPDEVWNFRRGDGIEKALLLADVIARKNPAAEITISIDNEMVKVESGEDSYFFKSSKSLRKLIKITQEGYESSDLA